MDTLLTATDIRKDRHFQRDIESEPLASMDGLLAWLYQDQETEIDIFCALNKEQDYLEHIRIQEAQRLIDKHGDSGCLELIDEEGRLAAILPEPSSRGGMRVSYYTVSGPVSHELQANPLDATVLAIKRGYRKPAPGQLDAMTSLPSWHQGMKWIELLRKHNGNPFPFLKDNPNYFD